MKTQVLLILKKNFLLHIFFLKKDLKKSFQNFKFQKKKISNLTESKLKKIVGFYKSGAIEVFLKYFAFPPQQYVIFQERDSMTDLSRSGRPKILNTDHRQAL